MRTDTPQPIRLSDYRPPAYLIDTVDLDFRLEPTATRVRASLAVRRQGDHAEPLRLDGVRLKALSFAVDGVALGPDRYLVDEEGVTITGVPAAFTLVTEVEIDP